MTRIPTVHALTTLIDRVEPAGAVEATHAPLPWSLEDGPEPATRVAVPTIDMCTPSGSLRVQRPTFRAAAEAAIAWLDAQKETV